MNALSWLSEAYRDPAFTLLILLAKITVLLAAGWALHALVARRNPLWRILIWRSTTVGVVVVTALAAFPGVVFWEILPVGQDRFTERRQERNAAPATRQLASDQANATASAPLAERTNNSTSAHDVPASDSTPETSPTHRIARRSKSSTSRRLSQTATPAATELIIHDRATAVSVDDPSRPAQAHWKTGLTTALFSTWIAGIILLIARTAIALARIQLIRKRAQPAPQWLAAEAVTVAQRLRCRARFDLRQTNDITTPCLVGLTRPAILLPLRQCNVEHRREVQAVLAHEIAHLCGADLCWNALLYVLSLVLWFHPLAWRIRPAHARACDSVADHVAANYLGDAAWYARLLARLALEVLRPLSAPALAMAQTSNVRRRIQRLGRHAFAPHPPRRLAAPAVTAAAIGIVLLGAVTLAPSRALVADEQAITEPSQGNRGGQQHNGRMVIQTVPDGTGKPLEGVAIHCHGRVGGDVVTQHLATDARGRATFEWTPGATVQNLWMTADKTGFVPVHYTWRSDRRAIELPQNLEMRFQPGTLIGGIVQNKWGQPIAGAQVELTMPITWPRLANYVFTAAELTTDKDGRWRWPNAPADLGLVGMRVKHPDYRPGGGRLTKNGDCLAVLDQGLTVKGRALDADGKPIKNAVARLGFDHFGSSEPKTITTDDGYFVLKNCAPGKSLVTVQAEGFAPQFQELTVGEKLAPLEFKLQPGKVMRLRVVDDQGKPIVGAIFATDTWRSYRTVEFRRQTDVDGRVEWTSAPPDTVLCDVLASGFMTVRRAPLTSSDKEHVVTLHRELVISGRVIDAVTGQPVPSFSVRHAAQYRGRDGIVWSRDEGVPFADGEYSMTFEEPSEGYVLQFVAPGFLPAESPKFASDKGPQTFDVVLQPGNGPSGTVLLPGGDPAKGVEVALATRENRVYLRQGRFDRSRGTEVTKSDAEGRFEFLPRGDEPFVLVAVHDEGYAEVASDDFAKSRVIDLQPWGQVEGHVRIGDRPDANRPVVFYPQRARRDVDYDYQTTTDAGGAFRFERVIPGRGVAARVTVTAFQKSWLHTPGWHTSADVQPGATTEILVGGSGRAVVGRLKVNRQADVALDWTTNEPVTIERKRSSDEAHFRCTANIDKSGGFSIPDVPAGNYRLHLRVNNPPLPNSCGAGSAIGEASLHFTLPEGDSHRPLDLGAITATLFDTLDVGEIAPDFVAEALEGDPVRLSKYRGKVVLLNFWATWCAPCLAEMPLLQEIHKEFGGNERFAIVGLSCDSDLATAKKYLAEAGHDWRQAYIGQAGGGVADRFTVRSFPATFLIGPDQRVLAKNPSDEKLKEAVAAALGDEAMFRISTTQRAARFPVTRFDPEPNRPQVSEKLAAIVLDNTDPTFERDKPHHDRLIAMDDSGEELWRHTGFNNAQTVGGVHGIAIDRSRQRVYVREDVTKRITAFDLSGQRLWQIDNVEADTLAVDEKTGHLWASGGPTLNQGETIVFDPDGAEVAAHPYRGVDIAYDARAGAFWLVGYEIIKLSREGKLLFRKRVDGWCCSSVAVNPTDGSLWIAERDHPDVPRSRNRLWLLSAQGETRRTIALEKNDPFAVACVATTGEAWVACLNAGLRRFSTDGEIGEPLPINASQVSISPTSNNLWVTTKEAVLRLDADGRILKQVPFGKESNQAWLMAF